MFLMNIYFYLFLIISLFLFFYSMYLLNYNYEFFVEFTLLSLNSVSFVYVIYVDWVSMIFTSFVFYISSMVVKYSMGYMSDDINIKRFILLVFLFIISMMLMILSTNLVAILLGWDGLGLVSYALVVYYQNSKSYNAGMLTALSNRIGDAALLMSIVYMVDKGGWNYMNYVEMFKTDKEMVLLLLLIILAALTKSAQIPFSAWLPAAMAAPTPVSSLVHSSTLVTAGVYLLYRWGPSFNYQFNLILLFVALFTMFMAGLAANFEYDLKKIIAMSTLSQLGMMMVILISGEYNLALFHLLAHALFKALLFMCAGVIIHNLGSIQDIRYLSSLSKSMPLTSSFLVISNLSLCGLPFLSGFYSKDLLIESLSMKFLSIFVYFVFYISIGLTVTYSFRLFYYIFWKNNSNLSLNMHSDDNNKTMLKGMFGLIFLVIIKGCILSWLLFPIPYFIALTFFMKMLTLFTILIGAMLGFELSCIYLSKVMMSYSYKKISSFLANMWNLPILSSFNFSSYFLKLGKKYYKNFDQGWLEYYGSKGIFNWLKNFSQFLQLFSNIHMKKLLTVVFILFVFITLFMLLI